MGQFGLQTNKKKPVLAQCEVLDNCMQHSLMANLMANAYEALSYDRQFIGIFLPHFQTAQWTRYDVPHIKD